MKFNKSGLTPIFGTSYVANVFKDYIATAVNREVAILIRVGETFVNTARQKHEYTDRTGNLTSSIGYILILDGKIVNQNFSGSKPEGVNAAKKFAEQITNEYSKGLVLVGFAGMNYAAAVESKNYDVISGSAPTEEMMKKAFEKFLK